MHTDIHTYTHTLAHKYKTQFKVYPCPHVIQKQINEIENLTHRCPNIISYKNENGQKEKKERKDDVKKITNHTYIHTHTDTHTHTALFFLST